MTRAPWQFWIDRGGTFTDVVARDPTGAIRVAKLLSEDPGRHEDAAISAMREMTGSSAGPLPPLELRIGTTIATNALLERKGEPVLLAITRGFGDALRIGYQERPDTFARAIVRPPPLYADVIEIDERVTAEGEILRAIDVDGARAALLGGYERGLRAIAIVLMHGWRHPAHESMLAQIAGEIGFTQVSVGHEVAPLIRLIGRGDTTVADAGLSPVLRGYVAGLERTLGPETRPLFMQSSGGLAHGRAFRGKDAILSGPAGGIVGMVATAREAGFDRVIGFDMGGTSTDVSHYGGAFERDDETIVAGVRIRAPMLRIHTVAAGGGSICRVEGTRLLVGPESAGAVPGPACYRRGGPLTVTDCNLLLGKLQPHHFPRLFGASGDEPIDRDASMARMEALLAEVGSAGDALSIERAAEGFVTIAVANMANAIKRISVARGHDVAGYTLACFGGAGGQHACLVADALGMERVLIHPLAGVLSAYGMGLADRRVLRERTLALPFAPGRRGELDAALDRLAAEARGMLLDEDVDAADIATECRVHLRYAGSDSRFEVSPAPHEDMLWSFRAAHGARFGFAGKGEVVVEMIAAEAIARTPRPTGAVVTLPIEPGAPVDEVEIFCAGERRRAPVHARERLARNQVVDGPALIVDPVSTVMIELGWQARVDALGNLVLGRASSRSVARAALAVDPVRLEIFGGLFMGIAEEMGAALQHSASSVNIRERLDFSCALFDAAGNLVANAPHMPVHLGSMGESIRTILARRGGGAADGRGIRPGDAYALNAPYDGGTHLPDITVVMPVFVDGAASPFFVAARGHHADVGGISPGSMPADSRSIDEEGVLLDNILILDAVGFREAELRASFASGRWPARNIDQNIADLVAQLAACRRGAEAVVTLCAEQGVAAVTAYMEHVQHAADQAVRRLIRGLRDGSFRYAMDSGAEVRVAVSIDRETGTMTVDFAGTSAQQSDNFNAPRAITRAAVLYAVRTLIDEPVPMNDGCLRAVRIAIPEGSMLDPKWPAAVVAGNVETSQVVTDAIFGALGAMAAAQGTMNNFTFGNDRHQYYETIAGGAGAGPGFDGADAVQTHMTNSRLTDPEVLETRFPVLVEAFAIRCGSGGTGEWRGGDGAVRRIRFREAMSAAILANRRIVPPFGLAGGAEGAVGINRIERGDGSIEELPATASAEMDAGDVFVIETPGGGGYGQSRSSRRTPGPTEPAQPDR